MRRKSRQGQPNNSSMSDETLLLAAADSFLASIHALKKKPVRSKLCFRFRCLCSNTYVILYIKFGDLFEQSCSTKVHIEVSFFSLLNWSCIEKATHCSMLLSSWIKPAENAIVIEWKKRKSVMTKLRKGSNPVFLKYNSEFDSARGELLYQVTHGVQRRRIFRTREPR